jgi:sigma-E factor negative regulatory protein RseB
MLLGAFGFISLSVAGPINTAAVQSEPSSEPSLATEQSLQSRNESRALRSEIQQVIAEELAQDVLKVKNIFDPLSAISWLERLARQTSLLNYEVSFVLNIPGKDTQPFLWRHAKMDDGTQIEQLSLLNGPGFENIRVNDVVSVFQPGYPPYSMYGNAIDGPIPYALLHEPEQLQMSYQFLLVGRNRISGRSA